MFERKWASSSRWFGVAGLALGLVTFLGLRAYASRIEAMNPGPAVGVVVAASDLARGSVLRTDQIALEQIPQSYVDPEAVTQADHAIGRVALTDISAGEPITSTRISQEASGGLAGLVPAGLRAIVVSTTLPEGIVRSGDHVDVVATAEGQAWADTVGESIEVLRTLPASGGAMGSASDAGGATVALLVDPAEAERIARAQTIGTITLTVASSGETPPATETPSAMPSP